MNCLGESRFNFYLFPTCHALFPGYFQAAPPLKKSHQHRLVAGYIKLLTWLLKQAISDRSAHFFHHILYHQLAIFMSKGFG